MLQNLGPKYLPFVLKELKADLRTGYAYSPLLLPSLALTFLCRLSCLRRERNASLPH